MLWRRLFHGSSDQGHPRPETTIRSDSPPEIRIERRSGLDALAPWRARWNALAARSRTATVFQTFEWHASWWTAFGDKHEPFVVTLMEDDALAGIAPLMLSQRWIAGRRRRVLQFIGLHASDYCDFIFDQARPHVLGALLDWLAAHADLWDVLDLSNLPDGAAALEVPTFFARPGLRTDVRFWTEAPTWVFGDAAADRKLVSKKSLRRHHNHFARQGRLDFVHLKSAPEILPWLDAFFAQHVERWAATDTPSQFRDRRQRRFYWEMVANLAPTGALLFSVVLLDGTPLAFHLGFDYGDRIIWYKPTYNVAFARHSPGEVLIKGLLEHALAEGVAEFDFSCGEEGFKYRFANRARAIRSVHVFRESLPAYGDRLAFDLRVWAKRSPLLTSIARGAKRLRAIGIG